MEMFKNAVIRIEEVKNGYAILFVESDSYKADVYIAGNLKDLANEIIILLGARKEKQELKKLANKKD